MNKPIVAKGDWIKIGQPHHPLLSAIDGLVMAVHDDFIEIGYYQNKNKAIRTEVIWDGEHWQFKTPAPHGTYIHGKVEDIIIKGPPA